MVEALFDPPCTFYQPVVWPRIENPRSRRMTRITIIAAALVIAPVGCSYNPGYFPYLLPPGHITQEHAKPRGPGYFRNFDPKACKLEVCPGPQVTAPLGSQI